MKYLAALSLFFVLSFGASFAMADQVTDLCAGQPAPGVNMHYPLTVMPSVVSGKITATVRKDIRCYKVGDVLTLTDPNDQGNYGKVKVEKVVFTNFNALSQDIVSRTGETSIQSLQQELITAYGQDIKSHQLTEIYFTIFK